ncbi:MAG: PAS domain S-box protein [Chloroflexota bacterium]
MSEADGGQDRGVRASDARVALLLQHIGDAVFETDPDLVVIAVNGPAEEIYGIKAEATIGARLNEIAPLNVSQEDLQEITQQVNAEILRREMVQFDAKGHLLHVRMTVLRPGDSSGFLIINKLVNPLADHSPHMIAVLDSRSQVTYANPSAIRFLGFPPNQTVGADIFSRVRDVHEGQLRAALRSTLQQPGHTETVTFQIRQADDSWRWIEAAATNCIDEPDVRGIVFNFHDVTRARETEESLSHQRQLMETMLDHLPVMVAMFDTNGDVVFMNREAERALGWSEKEIRGLPDAFAMLYPDPEEQRQMRAFILDAGGVWTESMVATKDGRRLPLMGLSIRVGEMLVEIGMDLTERQRVEDQSRHARDEIETRVEEHIEGRAAPYGLTFRELTVLTLVASGKTDREIALTLGIGHRTVQSHISSILTKMGARVRTEVGVRAVREGIIP